MKRRRIILDNKPASLNNWMEKSNKHGEYGLNWGQLLCAHKEYAMTVNDVEDHSL